jgi:NifU-like protein involved in Fe-S cluster formation
LFPRRSRRRFTDMAYIVAPWRLGSGDRGVHKARLKKPFQILRFRPIFGAPCRKSWAPPIFPAMLDDIYNKRILELAGTIPRLGRLESPDASARAHSRLCGSTVTVDLKMDGDMVTDFAHEVKACALGQASSSIMARHVVGARASELRDVREAMLKMLKENGAPPEGRFADLQFLEPVRDYKARHASTMLTFDAVVDAIGQIEAKRAAAG